MGTDLYIQPGITPNFNRLSTSRTAPTLIGLSGYARSGKDTVAQIIGALYGHERIAFADKLKDLSQRIDPYVAFPGSNKHRLREALADLGPEDVKTIPEVRRIYQVVGNEVRNVLGENVWVDAALNQMEPGKSYVISDVRYPNEALEIKRQGGMVYRVIREGVGPANDHISEVALDKWEFDNFIINDGDLVDLEGEVQRILGEFS